MKIIKQQTHLLLCHIERPLSQKLDHFQQNKMKRYFISHKFNNASEYDTEQKVDNHAKKNQLKQQQVDHDCSAIEFEIDDDDSTTQTLIQGFL